MEEIKRQLNKEEYLDYIEKWKEENKELIDLGKCNKVFIENLSRSKSKKTINWRKCNDAFIYFICENNEGWIKILNNIDENSVLIEYNNKKYIMRKRVLLKCKYKDILDNYYYNIDSIIKGKYSDIQIIERKIFVDDKNHKHKIYTYKCLKCGNTHKIDEYKLNQGQGCNICCPNTQKVVKEINSIWTTNPELVKYFVNEEDSWKYTGYCNKNVLMICPNCGCKKEVRISSLSTQGFRCDKCYDGISIPNKLIFRLLERLGMKFKSEYSPKWISPKRYDFYFTLNGEQYVCEVNGIQHYEETNRGRSLRDEQENDRTKKELALSNGIKEENYIVIDCRKSELNWIKEHILNSKFNEIFDMSNIDWNRIYDQSMSSKIKESSDLWNNGYTVSEIANEFKLCSETIRKYLRKAMELNWCIYNAKESSKIRRKKTVVNRKQIICMNNGLIFNSLTECSNKSDKILGVHLFIGNIAKVCKGIRNSTNGFQFKYTSDLTEEQIKEIQENAKLTQII